MIAPKFMRAAQIQAVLDTAVYEIDSPIDRIEISGRLAHVSAGGKTLTIQCRLEHSSDEDGHPVLGCDHWVTDVVGAEMSPRGLLNRIAGLFGR